MSDYSLTTFDQSGILTQVKHALTAVQNGETCLGIVAKNGVVIASEKKLGSVLVDETSFSKIEQLSDFIGITYSGIGPVFNSVIKKSRKDVQEYSAKFQDKITPFMLCK